MERIWWKQVTNAVKYVSDIRENLLEEKSILLKHSDDIPWRSQFEDLVRETVKFQNSEKKFVNIPVISNPGEYLLNEFCKKEKRAEYRPSKGYSRFFAESEDIVLHDRYLWIKIDSNECLENWMTIVTEYIKERGKNNNVAVFILDWCGEGPAPVKKGIRVFDFDSYIGEYDRIVFAMLASSSIKENAVLISYIAELVANISGNDIELSAECIVGYKDFLENPLDYIKDIIREKKRSDGTSYSFEKDIKDIEHLIWLAQIKTVYPRLEEYREDFVQKHSYTIAKQLPIQSSYGELYSDPKDVELGTLMYMAGNGTLVLSTTEYEKLKKYKDARNNLSHLNSLSVSELRELL